MYSDKLLKILAFVTLFEMMIYVGLSASVSDFIDTAKSFPRRDRLWILPDAERGFGVKGLRRVRLERNRPRNKKRASSRTRRLRGEACG